MKMFAPTFPQTSSETHLSVSLQNRKKSAASVSLKEIQESLSSQASHPAVCGVTQCQLSGGQFGDMYEKCLKCAKMSIQGLNFPKCVLRKEPHTHFLQI